MFLNESDYVVIGADALKVIQQSTATNREKAEKMAQEELSGYLRGRYDVEAVFAAEGEDRNDVIVMYMCDITLYNLISWLPNRMGFEIREIRYKRAIEWLLQVQNGKTSPDLPTMTGPDGEVDFYNPVRFGLGERNNYSW